MLEREFHTPKCVCAQSPKELGKLRHMANTAEAWGQGGFCSSSQFGPHLHSQVQVLP